VYARGIMQAFTVVIALLAVAALGWALSAAARRVLRRHGVPTDEPSVRDAGTPGPTGGERQERDRAGEPADDDRAGD
jgi:hypothetical protein